MHVCIYNPAILKILDPPLLCIPPMHLYVKIEGL